MPYIILFPEENDNFLVAKKSYTEGLNRVIGLNFAKGIGQPQKIKAKPENEEIAPESTAALRLWWLHSHTHRLTLTPAFLVILETCLISTMMEVS